MILTQFLTCRLAQTCTSSQLCINSLQITRIELKSGQNALNVKKDQIATWIRRQEVACASRMPRATTSPFSYTILIEHTRLWLVWEQCGQLDPRYSTTGMPVISGFVGSDFGAKSAICITRLPQRHSSISNCRTVVVCVCVLRNKRPIAGNNLSRETRRKDCNSPWDKLRNNCARRVSVCASINYTRARSIICHAYRW